MMRTMLPWPCQNFRRELSMFRMCVSNSVPNLRLKSHNCLNFHSVMSPSLVLRSVDNYRFRLAYIHIPGGNSKDTEEKLQHRKVQERIWTIPNLLCAARIMASPVLCYSILNSQTDVAVAILCLASLTDFADGQIARKFPNQASKIGTFLDPLADKILIVSLYSALTFTGTVPGYLTVLIVFRDVLLLAAGFYIRFLSLSSPRTVKKFFDGSHSSAELKPTFLSKANTAVQLITASISLYAPNMPFLSHTFLEYLWYTASCSTILSGLSYAINRKKTYSISKRK